MGAEKVKPSLGLLCGTNEDAEDLTGQRAPLASSRWRSEVQAQYVGRQAGRPTSAPAFNPRLLSLMDNQEPVFHHTKAPNKQYLSKTATYRILRLIFTLN